MQKNKNYSLFAKIETKFTEIFCTKLIKGKNPTQQVFSDRQQCIFINL